MRANASILCATLLAFACCTRALANETTTRESRKPRAEAASAGIPLRAADALAMRDTLVRLGVPDAKAHRVASDLLRKLDVDQPRASLERILRAHGVILSPLKSVRTGSADVLYVMLEASRVGRFEAASMPAELVADYKALARGATTRDVFLAKWWTQITREPPRTAAKNAVAVRAAEASDGVARRGERARATEEAVAEEVTSGGGNGSFRARVEAQLEERERAAASRARPEPPSAADPAKSSAADGEDPAVDESREVSKERRKKLRSLRGPKAPKAAAGPKNAAKDKS